MAELAESRTAPFQIRVPWEAPELTSVGRLPMHSVPHDNRVVLVYEPMEDDEAAA